MGRSQGELSTGVCGAAARRDTGGQVEKKNKRKTFTEENSNEKNGVTKSMRDAPTCSRGANNSLFRRYLINRPANTRGKRPRGTRK